MTNFNANEDSLAEQLETVELYVQTQGDKFHPLSDSLLEIIEDAAAGAEEATRAAVLDDLLRYEGIAEPKLLQYHSYHIGRIREMFADEHSS